MIGVIELYSMSSDLRSNLALVAGTALVTYFIVYKLLEGSTESKTAASCCAEKQSCCAEKKSCCAEKDSCCAEQKLTVDEARKAHTQAKKDLAHAENNHALGKMPKRMVEAVRRKEQVAKAALDAAIAAQ